MQQLRLGDPIEWQTDVGPVIDPDAKASLVRYLTEHSSQLLFQLDARATGNFVPPTLLRVMRIDEVNREAFGPILHILRYRESETHGLIDQINAMGFGLTCGIHSRNHVKAVNLAMRLRVGNIYINRDIIGANVGAQPFGGMGKSGTGPKAGGPHYLFQFTSEKTITTNTAALGGDHKLLSL
jgi:RHH-type proline utilization regulon transcriptional repressor/proline dehydrogenase/delta 1-pyrroline-5-carboxylate dehydrogenase